MGLSGLSIGFARCGCQRCLRPYKTDDVDKIETIELLFSYHFSYNNYKGILL